MPTTEPTPTLIVDLERAAIRAKLAGFNDDASRLSDAAQRLRQEMANAEEFERRQMPAQSRGWSWHVQTLDRINGGAGPLHQDTGGEG